VLGVEVTAEKVDLSDDNRIVVVCTRGKSHQRIPILDLPLPKPPPKGAEWIDAYRRWACFRSRRRRGRNRSTLIVDGRAGNNRRPRLSEVSLCKLHRNLAVGWRCCQRGNRLAARSRCTPQRPTAWLGM
jgi:hypothetical protein